MATKQALKGEKGAATKKTSSGESTTLTRAAPSGRSYVSQEDVPAYPLEEATRISAAIYENYGGHASTPLDVATALDLQPTSSHFRMLCGASIAYGLTEGGYNAKTITPTALASRIHQPLEDGDDLLAKREAVLKPKILREFLSKYSGSSLPRVEIGLNVLKSMGVPPARAEAVWSLILATAEKVGYIRPIKDKQYVDLGTRGHTQIKKHAEALTAEQANPQEVDGEPEVDPQPALLQVTPNAANDMGTRRVFITHGKNTAFIEPIKKLLGFGEMTPIVSVEKQSVSQPVPDKVMNDMRSCSAAIIHVDGEQTLIDSEAKEHTVINPNVLIEIGAAMALYGRRFILLVRNGVKLPSNLQGLYEVRYDGDALDGNVTIRLREAINEMKKTALPGPTSS